MGFTPTGGATIHLFGAGSGVSRFVFTGGSSISPAFLNIRAVSVSLPYAFTCNELTLADAQLGVTAGQSIVVNQVTTCLGNSRCVMQVGTGGDLTLNQNSYVLGGAELVLVVDDGTIRPYATHGTGAVMYATTATAGNPTVRMDTGVFDSTLASLTLNQSTCAFCWGEVLVHCTDIVSRVFCDVQPDPLRSRFSPIMQHRIIRCGSSEQLC